MMQSKELQFEIKANGRARTFTGLAAAFSLDRGGDVILPGAFKRTIADWKRSRDKTIPLVDSHSYRTIRAIVGKVEDAKETADGLEATFEIIDGPDGDEVFRRVKGGYVDGLSIGYEAIEVRQPSPEQQKAGVFRILKEVRLLEVSLVLFPMNTDARIAAGTVRSSDGKIGGLAPDDSRRRALESFVAAIDSDERAQRIARIEQRSGLAPEDPRRVHLEQLHRDTILRRLGIRTN